MDTRYTLICLITVINIILVTKISKAQTENKGNENIVLITTHDLGQHIGSYGVEEVRTPNIDRLAEKGVRFENAYSTSGVCTPGRGSLLTGTYPQTNGLMGLTHSPWGWSFHKQAKSWHIANILKERGYSTHLFGFQHVTQGPVKELGYQEHLSRDSDAEDTVREVGNLFKEKSENKKPFFAKVGFTEVHRSFTNGVDSSKGIFVPPYLENTPVIREDLARFQAEINYLDSKVGEILSSLNKHPELLRNTVVVFTSEHGIPYPGAKWTARKAGIEVPLIFYMPDSFLSGGNVYDSIISNVDVLPTLLDIINVDRNEEDQIEGVSFYDYLRGSTEEEPREMAFSQYTVDMKRDNLSRGVITKDYHLIRYFDQGRSVDYPTSVNPKRFASHIERMKTAGSRPFTQLFDLTEDPYELNNVSNRAENQNIVQALSPHLLGWMQKVGDDLLNGPLETPYYRDSMRDLLEE